MLRLFGPGDSASDSLHRREMLRVGGLMTTGLTLSHLFQNSSQAANKTSATSKSPGFGAAKNCIILYLSGGAPQHDTFDPKPDSPADIRGEFSTIESSLPGARVGEHLPLSSKIMHKVAQVAKDCPLGLYGMRLATEDGLSNLCLLLVDDIPPRTSVNSPQKKFPVAVAGELRPAAADRYTIQVKDGERMTFDVVASRLGTDADPLVTIFDSHGRRVAQRDNDPGLFFDCCFEHTFQHAGTYTVEVRDSRFHGSPHWRFVLRMGPFPAARVAIPSAVRAGEKATLRFAELGDYAQDYPVPKDLPPGGFFFSVRRPKDAASNWAPMLCTDLSSVVEVEPNDVAEQATAAESGPVMLHGIINRPGDKDQFLLDLNKGEKVTFRAECRPLNSPADVELALFDSTGREVQRVDDVTLPGGIVEEASLTFTANKEGKFRLQIREVTEQGGPEFAYRVEVRSVTPRIQLSSPVSSFTVPQQSYQRLPLSVARTDYTGPIDLALVDAPAGLRLEPDAIPEGATSVDCKLVASDESPRGVYTFSISASAISGEQTLTSLVSVQPLVDRQLTNVDLIKYALRDNQRWLPPSVTNRLALQVTPPIPFTVDLAEATVTLPRYQQTEVNILTGRSGGFSGPIVFSAAGGQLGEESQGRRQVFGRFPVGMPSHKIVSGTIHSRSQAQELKERIDLSAVAKDGERWITLVRSFLLDVRPAFSLAIEPAQVTAAPGDTVKVRLALSRLGSFVGPVTIEPPANVGVTLPESVTILGEQSGVELELVIAADCKPGRRKIRFPASGQVNGFQEEIRPVDLDLEVKLDKKT